MKKWFSKLLISTLILGTISIGYSKAEVKAADITIPVENSRTESIGVTMPYTRYDSTAAIIGGGAVLAKSDNFAEDNIASQASEQSYVRLPGKGAYAKWTMNTSGDGVTMRFTMPDTADGMGQDGSLDIYVNDKKVTTVELTSYYMWQYFEEPNASNPTGSPKDEPVDGATASFAFDETHFKLNTSLKKGDVIKVMSTGKNNLEYGVDFLEIEEVPTEIKKPDNAYSITDYGADGTDEYDDYGAIQKCITFAKQDGKDVYIPAGTYRISQMWRLNVSDVKITGAGMWHTNIQFTNSAAGGGGISGTKANNVEFCNMYINSNLRSRYKQNATYKCFMDVWSGGSYIHDIWQEHFECGFWLADYNFNDGEDYCDGIVIANSRIRNNFADGVNFCQGTSDATVYNCSIRNTGDDGLAMWNNSWKVKDESNNVFCYNTIDFVWRAGAIAVYGGDGHKIYNNYIADTFMASGIHLNTAFDGYKFTNNTGIDFSNNIIVRSGTTSDSWNSSMGAIDISGDVKNVTFNNTYIYDAQHNGVTLCDDLEGIVFNNLSIYGTGIDGNTTNSNDNGAAIRYDNINTIKNITYNGLTYANIPYANILYGSRILSTFTNEINYGASYNYVVPAGTNKIITEPVKIQQEQVTTTGKNDDTIKVKVAKTKVKLAKKKLKEKKVKVFLKKVKGATRYQIQISKTKVFKKVLVNKKVKKIKVTIKSKAIKDKKKLYVRARVYKKINGVTYKSSWTKAKKIKVSN